MARVGLPGVATARARIRLSALRPEDQVMLLGDRQRDGSARAVVSRPGAGHCRRSITLEPWGTTPLYDADARGGRRDPGGLRAARADSVSDGTDRYSQTTARTLLDRVRRKDVLIYPIALRQDTRRRSSRELAAVTGGRSFQVANVSRAAGDACRRSRSELRFQYLLGYAPPRAAGDAGWRSIQVRVNRPDARVRARDGYVARDWSA